MSVSAAPGLEDLSEGVLLRPEAVLSALICCVAPDPGCARYSLEELTMAAENLRVQPSVTLAGWDDVQCPAFSISFATVDGHFVVRPIGELDLATRDEVYCACVNGDQTMVTVDLFGVTFMDCAGYSALAAARRVLEDSGGSLTLDNPTGKTARLLDLLANLGTPDEPTDPDRRWNRWARFVA